MHKFGWRGLSFFWRLLSSILCLFLHCISLCTGRKEKFLACTIPPQGFCSFNVSSFLEGNGTRVMYVMIENPYIHTYKLIISLS